MLDDSDPTRGHAHFLELAGRRPARLRLALFLILLVPLSLGVVEAAKQVRDEVATWRNRR